MKKKYIIPRILQNGQYKKESRHQYDNIIIIIIGYLQQIFAMKNHYWRNGSRSIQMDGGCDGAGGENYSWRRTRKLSFVQN